MRDPRVVGAEPAPPRGRGQVRRGRGGRAAGRAARHAPAPAHGLGSPGLSARLGHSVRRSPERRMKRAWLILALTTAACRGDAPPPKEVAVTTAPGALSPLSVESASAATRSDSIDSRRRTLLTDAVAKVSPAVVTVQTEVVQNAPVDPFDAFFGGAGSGQRVLQGLGTG